jgi:hypothetical protein
MMLLSKSGHLVYDTITTANAKDFDRNIYDLIEEFIVSLGMIRENDNVRALQSGQQLILKGPLV